MLYNLANPLEVQSARTYLETLSRKGEIAEIKKKDFGRTLEQNAYLHVILGYFAKEVGHTLDYVKRKYYKELCNSDLYLRGRFYDRLTCTWEPDLRSSCELSMAEMRTSIERFRNWAASEAGIYLPEREKKEEVAAMRMEVEKHRLWI